MMLWLKAIFLTALVGILVPLVAVVQIILIPAIIIVGLLLFFWFVLKMNEEDQANDNDPKT